MKLETRRVRSYGSTALVLAVIALSLVLAGCGGSVKPPGAAAGNVPVNASSGGDPGSGSGSDGSSGTGGSGASGAKAIFLFNDIDDMNGWTHCANTMNGKQCAGGQGFAPTSLTQHESQPSLVGSSAHFWLGGDHKYSNVMWWRDLQNFDSKAKTYRWEFNVYMKRPELPEALEFDVNQSAKGIRWVMGTECSFRDTHHWDVWDADAHWVTTPAPCHTFKANTWTHVAWNIERVDDHVHYISVEVNGVTYPVDVTTKAEKNWPWAGSLGVAFQMDGNINQDDFDVWLDQLSVTGW